MVKLETKISEIRPRVVAMAALSRRDLLSNMPPEECEPSTTQYLRAKNDLKRADGGLKAIFDIKRELEKDLNSVHAEQVVAERAIKMSKAIERMLERQQKITKLLCSLAAVQAGVDDARANEDSRVVSNASARGAGNAGRRPRAGTNT